MARRCRCWRAEKERRRTWLRSALQADTLDGENNGFMQILKQAFRPFERSVKGQL